MLDWLKTILGDAHTEDIEKKVEEEIGKHFIARTDFNAVNDAKKKLEQDVQTRDQQIAELRKADPAGLQKEIDRLQKKNAEDAAAYEAQLRQTRLDAAVDAALVEAKARNHTAVRALLDMEKIELSEDGKIKGLKDQLKKLTEAEDTGFLFQPEQAQLKGLKPGEGMRGPDGKVDVAKMSYEELAAYMEANPDTEI